MPFRLYNTLTRSVEEFTPADPENVTFYSCGPTVYDFAHIGNFRSFLLADVLRRWIESPLCEVRTPGPDGKVHQGPRNVRHVMNITDVGHMVDDDNADGGGVDRMEEGARRLTEAKKSGKLPPGAPADINPNDPFQIADFYANAFLADARLLGLKVALEAEKNPDLMPRPTRKVPQMQAMIRELHKGGFAYIVDGPTGAGSPGTAVYFDVARFNEYGKLSGNTLDALRAGAGGRVSAANQSAKHTPADFLLWKVDPAHKMSWLFDKRGDAFDAFEKGYPGWHIECSAMSREALGNTIDLHSGGEDNIFPHHECEIAQSRCANSTKTFARHWFHVRHLQVEGEKMSKSKGNFYTIRDLVSKGFSPAAIRLELIKTHYRANANFTEQGLKDSERMVSRWAQFVDNGMPSMYSPPERDPLLDDAIADALSDDLNVSAALAAINAWMGSIKHPFTNHGKQLKSIVGDILGVSPNYQQPFGPLTDKIIAALNEAMRARQSDVAEKIRSEVSQREPAIDLKNELLIGILDDALKRRAKARKDRDYQESDRVRQELASEGYEVKDTADGNQEVFQKRSL
ncbi:MAG: cysteine--tRNA ligase [Phycisphaerales bacterium]